MNNRPKILVAPTDVQELTMLAQGGVDGFIVGSRAFTICSRGYFELNELKEAVTVAHQLNKKIYLTVDAIFPNDLLEKLTEYLEEIKELPFDGIRYSDLGVYMLLKEKLPHIPQHFVDQMMLTNYETVNYWANRGVSHVRLAPELTLEEILEIKTKATPTVEILVHGASMMFTSRRKLVENYLDFQQRIGKGVQLGSDGLHLYDPERDLYYPIIENDHGTHIFSGNDVCMVDDLAKLMTVGIDVFYIEGFTYDTEGLKGLVKLYNMAIDLALTDPEKYEKAGIVLYQEAEKLKEANRRMDRGFYYKPTIYKNQQK